MSTRDAFEDEEAMEPDLGPGAEAADAGSLAVDAALGSKPSTGPAPRRSPTAGIAAWHSAVVPAIVAHSGNPAAKRFLEFFAVTIHNPHTRMSYYRAACRFFAWCDTHGLPELAEIEPLHVAAYIETMQAEFEKPTVKQHLAALRMLFNWLVTGQILATNPAHSVRGPRHAVKTGKTTVLNTEDTRRLLDSIDVSTMIGLRDRALIAVMTFAFARVGAVVAMRLEDYYPKGKRLWIRLHEKGGKRHEMPAHHTLEAYLDAYIEAASLAGGARLPLFRAIPGRLDQVSTRSLTRIDAWHMVQRRAEPLGFRVRTGCHSFRATGITAYLEAGGTPEDAQLMAAHESPRTTKLYDRIGDVVTLDEVERIII